MSAALSHEQLIVRSFLLKVKRLYEDLRPLALKDEDQECLRVIAETLEVVDDLLLCVENSDEWATVAQIAIKPALFLPGKGSPSASGVESEGLWPL